MPRTNAVGAPAQALIAVAALLLLSLPLILALPEGPAYSIIANSTRSGTSGTQVDATKNGTDAGGAIYTMSLSATSQSNRWKGFVGNISGQLVLDDASGNTIYSWTLNSTFSGEVYATRFSGSVAWTNVNCSNTTHRANEDIALSLSQQDNITSTFISQTHEAFAIGTLNIAANSCFSIYTYVNDSSQSATSFFEEILLFDRTNNITIWSTIVEQNAKGYNSNSTVNITYDFQMIVPENGSVGWNSQIPYYFYVELV